MSSTQKKILFIDLACILISGFIFLFISPSIEGRQRIIYIVPQVLICAALVIGSRFLIGIYREYFMDVAGRNLSIMYMQLIIADAIACAVYYLIQLVLPHSMRITLVRLMCFVVFSLLEAIVCRLCYRTGFSLNENDRKILEAAAASGKSTEEILALLKK